MTREQANTLRAVINDGARYITNYSCKAETLRVKVYEQIDGYRYTDREREQVVKLLNRVANGYGRPKYEIKRIRYQGFLTVTVVEFR